MMIVMDKLQLIFMEVLDLVNIASSSPVLMDLIMMEMDLLTVMMVIAKMIQPVPMLKIVSMV